MEAPKGVFPPKEGWEENTWYLVEVSYFEGNPVHKSLFYTGFLHEGRPNGYNCLVPLHGTGGRKHTEIHEVRYLRAIKMLYKVEK